MYSFLLTMKLADKLGCIPRSRHPRPGTLLRSYKKNRASSAAAAASLSALQGRPRRRLTGSPAAAAAAQSASLTSRCFCSRCSAALILAVSGRCCLLLAGKTSRASGEEWRSRRGTAAAAASLSALRGRPGRRLTGSPAAAAAAFASTVSTASVPASPATSSACPDALRRLRTCAAGPSAPAVAGEACTTGQGMWVDGWVGGGSWDLVPPGLATPHLRAMPSSCTLPALASIGPSGPSPSYPSFFPLWPQPPRCPFAPARARSTSTLLRCGRRLGAAWALACATAAAASSPPAMASARAARRFWTRYCNSSRATRGITCVWGGGGVGGGV